MVLSWTLMFNHSDDRFCPVPAIYGSTESVSRKKNEIQRSKSKMAAKLFTHSRCKKQLTPFETSSVGKDTPGDRRKISEGQVTEQRPAVTRSTN